MRFWTPGFSLPVAVNHSHYNEVSWVALLLLGGVLLWALPPRVRAWLRRQGRVEANFRGDRILQGYGLLIALWSGLMLFAAGLLFAPQRWACGWWLTGIALFGLLGYADDVTGDKTIKGLRGHLRAAWRERRITSGFVKAIGGLLAAFALSLVVPVLHGEAAFYDLPDGGWTRSGPVVLLHTLLIALSANAVNLLDLRPGRAGGAFLMLSAALLAAFWMAGGRGVPLLLFVAIPALAVWRLDARAQAMLGDTGSNLLGATLGMALAAAPFPLWTTGVILVLLIALHIVAERHSLTKIIAANALLRRLDGWTGDRP